MSPIKQSAFFPALLPEEPGILDRCLGRDDRPINRKDRELLNKVERPLLCVRVYRWSPIGAILLALPFIPLSILEILFRLVRMVASPYPSPLPLGEQSYEARSLNLMLAFANQRKSKKAIEDSSRNRTTFQQEASYVALGDRLSNNSRIVVEKYEDVRSCFFRLIQGALQLPIREKPLHRVYQASIRAFTYSGIRARSLHPDEPTLRPEMIARYNCDVHSDFGRIISWVTTHLLAEMIAAQLLADHQNTSSDQILLRDPINPDMPTALQELADRWASDPKFLGIWSKDNQLSLNERVEQTSLFLAEEGCYPPLPDLELYSKELFAAIQRQLITGMLPPLLGSAYSLKSTAAEYIEEIQFLKAIRESSRDPDRSNLYTEQSIFNKHIQRLFYRMPLYVKQQEIPSNSEESADQLALRLSKFATQHINRQRLEEEYESWLINPGINIPPFLESIWPSAKDALVKIASDLVKAEASPEPPLPNPDAVWVDCERNLFNSDYWSRIPFPVARRVPKRN